MVKHMIVGIDVKNMPEIITGGYLVVRAVDGELWYYGVYSELSKARLVAREIINGVVLEV